MFTAEADNLNDLEAEYILLTDIEEDFDKVDGLLFLSDK